ncbi:hypothetical protein EJ07DRAFT_152575 [Lizonia empirigonia]|nr:hypothetical protein EJ07DRAFT_152575 [Lizonia empirigonia]
MLTSSERNNPSISGRQDPTYTLPRVKGLAGATAACHAINRRALGDSQYLASDSESSKRHTGILSYNSNTMLQTDNHCGLAYACDDIEPSSICGVNDREAYGLGAQTPIAVGEASAPRFPEILGTSTVLPLRCGHSRLNYNESTGTTRKLQGTTSDVPLVEIKGTQHPRQSSIDSHGLISTSTVSTGAADASEWHLRTSKLREADRNVEPKPLLISKEKSGALVETLLHKTDTAQLAPLAASQRPSLIVMPVETPQRVQDCEKKSIEPALPSGEAFPQQLRDVGNQATEIRREIKENHVRLGEDPEISAKRMAEVIKIKSTTVSHCRTRDESNDNEKTTSKHAAGGQNLKPPCLFLSNPHATSGPQPASRSKRVRFSKACVAIGSGDLEPIKMSEVQRNGITKRHRRRCQLSGAELLSGAQGLAHHFADRGDTNQVPRVSSVESLPGVEANRVEEVAKSSNLPSPFRTHIRSESIITRGRTLTRLYSITEKANVARKRKYIADLSDDDNGGEGPDLNRSKHALPSRRPRPSVQIGMPQTKAAEVAAAEYDGDLESEDGLANLSDDASEHGPGNEL